MLLLVALENSTEIFANLFYEFQQTTSGQLDCPPEARISPMLNLSVKTLAKDHLF